MKPIALKRAHSWEREEKGKKKVNNEIIYNRTIVLCCGLLMTKKKKSSKRSTESNSIPCTALQFRSETECTPAVLRAYHYTYPYAFGR